MSVYILL